MLAEPEPSVLEMAYVLFMDIVAYSTLPMDEQGRFIGRLQDAVKQTLDFSRAEARGDLICLPTGDGMALVFFRDPEAPVRCAKELSTILRSSPEIGLRMGIHTGPVYRRKNISANVDVAGGGINIAQRVMDCGDAGHILVSSTVAEVLQQLSHWKEALHDLGQVEVKHGVRLHIYNLLTEGAGNSGLPKKIKEAAVPSQPASSSLAPVSPVVRVWNMLVAPARAFIGLREDPSWWAPWLILSILAVLLAAMADQQIGFGPMIDNQIRGSARASARLRQQPSEEQVAFTENAVTVERYLSYGSPILLLVEALLVAALIRLAFKYLAPSDMPFVVSLAVVMYSLVPQLVRSLLGMAVVLGQAHIGGFTMQNPIPTNPAYFLDPASNPFLYGIASFFDFFQLWTVLLAVLGFSALANIRRGTTVGVVFASYLVVHTAIATGYSFLLFG